MKNVFIIVFLVFIISCKNDNLDLNGHWHIYKLSDNENGNSFYDYLSIDILDDTFGILNKDVQMGEGLIGYIDQKNNKFLFGGECLVANFRYKVKNGKLLLNQEYYDEKNDEKFIAKKCETNCCNKQKEYFNYSLLEIDLSIVRDTNKMLGKLERNRPYQIPISFGKMKPKYKEIYGKGYFFTIKDKIVDIDKLKEQDKLIESMFPENLRKHVKYIIYSDKQTPIGLIKELVLSYEEIGKDKFYIALREKSRKDELKLWVKKLEINKLRNADDEIRIENWIK